MRPIDADATIKDIDAQMELMEKLLPIPELKQMADEMYKGFVAQLNKMPTIDAVEVVRCKDCENHDYCTWYGCEEQDYCSYGRRKDETD